MNSKDTIGRQTTCAEPRAQKSIAIGTLAPDLVLSIHERVPSVRSLTFHTYPVTEGLEDRLAQSADTSLRKIFRRAARLRRVTGTDLPYWESILAAASPSRMSVLIRESLKHDPNREIRTRREVSVEQLNMNYLSAMMSHIDDREVLALCSKVRLRDGSSGHIPMMDFRCRPSAENLERTVLALREVYKGAGVILNSGRSYHFYGFSVLSGDNWLRFMASNLLLTPFTDARYIAHRLLDGLCALRISSAKDKPIVPYVEAVL